MKRKKKKFVANKLLIGIVIIALCILIYTTSYDSKPYSSDLESRIERELAQAKINQQRPDYLPGAMFQELPPFPKDFYQMRVLVHYGRITDLSKIGPEYWMQPEWYPDFEKIGVPLLQNPPKDRWAAVGYGIYPGDAVVTTSSGESVTLYTYLRSSYLVETYQGMQLVPIYPDSGTIETGYEFPDGTKTVNQNPESVKNYFDVSFEPNLFVLEPSFPIFKDGYIKRIVTKIDVAPNTPPGKYIIGIDIVSPPKEQVDEWIWEYKNLYTSAGMTQVGRPWYRAFIEIV